MACSLLSKTEGQEAAHTSPHLSASQCNVAWTAALQQGTGHGCVQSRRGMTNRSPATKDLKMLYHSVEIL